MTELAIIGGTGLSRLQNLEFTDKKRIHTPYGEPSSEFILGKINNKKVSFLARHGNPHKIPPHRINYRANLWGLKELGVEKIIAVAAVGGITAEMTPGRIAIPDQIIDYTYGRAHTFFEDDEDPVSHIDFTYPYSEKIRTQLIKAAVNSGLDICTKGVYGGTQGPRLETAAEIRRMERDGCDLVGMTGMPEAALARELGMEYAACAVVANWAAGKSEGEITMQDIKQNLALGMRDAAKIINQFLKEF